METLKIFRKRIIPAQCIELKDDIIIDQCEETVITKWETLNPKTAFSHGASCYYIKEGLKVSKFYRNDNSLLYWYCDIINCEIDERENALIATDLLADVIIYPDGRVKVVDLDELADAAEQDLITKEEMCLCLKRLNHLLTIIERDKFDKLQAPLELLKL